MRSCGFLGAESLFWFLLKSSSDWLLSFYNNQSNYILKNHNKNTKTNAREKNFKMDIDEKIEDIEENVGQIEVQFQSETGKFEC